MFTLICEEKVESYPIPTSVCDHMSLISEASGIVNLPGGHVEFPSKSFETLGPPFYHQTQWEDPPWRPDGAGGSCLCMGT